MTGNELKGSEAEVHGILFLVAGCVIIVIVHGIIDYYNNRRWVTKAGYRICNKCRQKYIKNKEYPTTLVRTPSQDALACDDCNNRIAPRVTVQQLMQRENTND